MRYNHKNRSISEVIRSVGRFIRPGQRLFIPMVWCFLGFNYGALVFFFKIPPFYSVKSGYETLLVWGNSDIAPERSFSDQEIAAIVRPKTRQQLDDLRRRLISSIWQRPDLPLERLPEDVSPVNDSNWHDLPNLGAIDQLTIDLHLGIKSIAYKFQARKSNNRLLIFHEGHTNGNFETNKTIISHFLEQGYDVLLIGMPFLLNNHPGAQWIETTEFGPIFVPSRMDDITMLHKYVRLMSSPDFGPSRFFFEPVVVALNQALSERAYDLVAMAGLSGGGWTTTIAAALDRRIDISFPVAGSLPFYLRSLRPGDLGDYEQYALPIYGLANYLELYLLASAGEGRQQVQILNANDPCCFARPEALEYGPILQDILSQMGAPGAFHVYIDDSHDSHIISPVALEIMDKHLE